MVKKAIVRKTTPSTISKTEAENSQLELFSVKSSMKALTKREGELKDRLAEYMGKTIKPDAKGHFMFSTVDEKGTRIHLQRQARKSVKLNQDLAQGILKGIKRKDLIISTDVVASEVTQDQVIEVLMKHAPHLLDKLHTVDEVALEQAVLSEEISMETFESMCDINITYAMTFIDDKKLQAEK